MKCPICKGEIKKKKVKEEMFGVYLGDYPADVCSKCGESFVNSKVMKQIEDKAKEKGIWGLGNRTKVAKAGNSLIVRVPKKLATFLGVHEGSPAFIHPESGKLVLDFDS